MKILPCQKCGPLGASLPPSLAYPKGEPALAGKYVSEYRCARCKTTRTLTPAQWARLPELRHADFLLLAKGYQAPQVASIHLNDFVGYGLAPEHAADVHDAGFRAPGDLEALEREAFAVADMDEAVRDHQRREGA